MIEETYLKNLNQIKKIDNELNNMFKNNNGYKKRYSLKFKPLRFYRKYCPNVFRIPYFFNFFNFILILLSSYFIYSYTDLNIDLKLLSLIPTLLFFWFFNYVYINSKYYIYFGLKTDLNYRMRYFNEKKNMYKNIKRINHLKSEIYSLLLENKKIIFSKKLSYENLGYISIQMLNSNNDIYIKDELLNFSKKVLDNKNYKKLVFNLNK